MAQEDNLAVHSAASGDYMVADFLLAREERKAVWTLSEAVPTDRIILDLNADASSGGVRGINQYDCLDGEWINDGTDTYPSGDGRPGGNFVFELNVLPGDANRDAAVNALDVAEVKRRLGSRTRRDVGAGYSIFADVNGDGRINALDVAAVKRRLGSRLPEGTSAMSLSAPPPPVLAASAVMHSTTRELFGLQPVLTP